MYLNMDFIRLIGEDPFGYPVLNHLNNYVNQHLNVLGVNENNCFAALSYYCTINRIITLYGISMIKTNSCSVFNTLLFLNNSGY